MHICKNSRTTGGYVDSLFYENIHLNAVKVNTIVMLPKCKFIAKIINFRQWEKKYLCLRSLSPPCLLDISRRAMLEFPQVI